MIYDHQTHNLSNRFGSEILRDSNGDVITPIVTELTGKAIEQIFQLEDSLIISSWDYAASVGSLVAYDEATELTTKIETIRTCKGFDSYNQEPLVFNKYVKIEDDKGGGIEGDLQSTGLDGTNTNHIDHIYFEFEEVGIYNPNLTTVTNYKDRFNVCHVRIEFQLFQNDGHIHSLTTWGTIRDSLNAAGHNFTVLGASSDKVYLTKDLATQNNDGTTKAKWGAESTYREPLTSRGHLKSSVFAGEAFIATEPYDKVFANHPDDINMEDPENFKPTTERATIKRITHFWDGSTSIPKVRDAQLPTTYLEESNKPVLKPNDTPGMLKLDSDYKFFLFTHGRWKDGDGGSDFRRYVNIWLDRRSGPTNGWDIAADGVLVPIEFIAFVQVPEVDGIPYDEFGVVDYIDVINDRFNLNGFFVPKSGVLYLVQNKSSITPPPILGSDYLTLIKNALTEYSERKDAYYSGIGFHVEPGLRFELTQKLNVVNAFSNSPDEGFYTSLPDSVGSYFYSYAYYLKESYVKLDDGIPKTVENLGPASILSVNTLSEITAEPNLVEYWELPAVQGTDPATITSEIVVAPTLYGSISKRFTEVAAEWFDFNDIVAVFSRTENTGSVYYDMYETNLFRPVVMKDAAIFDPTDWKGENYGYFTVLHDQTYDRDIIFYAQSYFNGGVSFYSGLPQGAHFVEVIKGKAYYANIINNASRVYESAPDIPSSSPSLFFSDFEDPVTALSSFLEKPIVFTENTTWRLEGKKDATGNGRVFQRTVSDEFGCISNQSVIKTNVGLFYWSKVGIIFTDGLRSMRVTEHLLERYQIWRDAILPNGLEIGTESLRGSYNEVTKRIFWSAIDPDTGIPIWIICDLYYGVSKSMPFYTASGPHLEDELYNFRKDLFQTRVLWFSEDASTMYRGEIGYDGAGDVAGSVVLTHKRSLTADECYETLTDTGFKVPIDPLLRSVAYSFGTKAYRKWVSKVTINLVDKNEAGVSLQPLGWNDLNTEYPHKLGRCINYQHFIDPLPTIEYDPGGGAPLITRYEQGYPPTLIQFFNNLDAALVGHYLVSYKRRFPRGRIRNTYKQFGIEQLVHEVTTIDTAALGVTGVQLTRIANQPNQPVQIDLTFSQADNAFFATYVRENGAHYVQFPDSTEWRKITKIYSHTQAAASFLVFDGINEIPTEIIEMDASFKMGRAPVDQEIQLSDYALTYTVIGDRTLGLPKATELGGSL